MATGIVNPHAIEPAGFNPETDINWHTLFWAEGTKYKALGYNNAQQIGVIPDEYGTAADNATMTLSPYFLHGTGMAGVLNGQPYWNTTATAHGAMSTGTWAKTSPHVINAGANNSASTVIIIFQPDNPTTTYSMFMDGPAALGYLYLLPPANGNVLTFYGTSTGTNGGGSAVPARLPTLGATNGIRWTRSATVSYIYLNALSVSTFPTAGGGYSRYGQTTNEGVQLCGYHTGTNYPFQGSMAFLGIYSDNGGDITQDPKYADLQSWALSHYGATLS